MTARQSRNAASFARAQANYDAMEPPEYYEEPDEPERVICDHAGEACGDCDHGREHDKTDDCGPAVCNHTGRSVICEGAK